MNDAFDPAWEDSLNMFDLRDLLYIELLERGRCMAERGYLGCPLGSCRRHRLCLGPMLPPRGCRVPPSWFQIGEKGMRPPCRHGHAALALKDILDQGPDAVLAMGEDRHGLMLSTRIARRRKERLAAGTARHALAAGEAAKIISPALRAGLFKFIA